MRPLARESLSSIAARVVVGGAVLGISNTDGDPAQDGGEAARGQVFLVLIAGFAEMDLGVDHTRQYVQAPGLENLRGAEHWQANRWRRCALR